MTNYKLAKEKKSIQILEKKNENGANPCQLAKTIKRMEFYLNRKIESDNVKLLKINLLFF